MGHTPSEIPHIVTLLKVNAPISATSHGGGALVARGCYVGGSLEVKPVGFPSLRDLLYYMDYILWFFLARF
jgi:hypothetical protein